MGEKSQLCTNHDHVWKLLRIQYFNDFKTANASASSSDST